MEGKVKILYTAFNGQDNSSKILLDKMSVDNVNKLYLRNSFETSVKQLIDKCSATNIIAHYKILSVDDKKITTDEDDVLLEEPLDKDIIEVLDGFFDFSKEEHSKSNQAMYDSLLTVEDSIENINTPKERQYILINNRK